MPTRHSQTTLLVHIVWSTAARARILPPPTDAWLYTRLACQCRDAGADLLAAGNAWDHVHAVVRWEPTQKLCDVIQRMKGGASRFWNLEHPEHPRLGWQQGYWAETVTPEDLDGLLAYVRRQRIRHEGDRSLERWELALLG
jgi:REP element-mobilizing transposase RayT